MADQFSQSIAIVYPAISATDPLAHSTILYLGEIPDVSFTKQDLEEAVDYVTGGNKDLMFYATVVGTENFGVNNDIPVLLLHNDVFLRLHKSMSEQLARKGIYSASEHSYRPHITVDEETIKGPPRGVLLKSPAVWWGSDRSGVVA